MSKKLFITIVGIIIAGASVAGSRPEVIPDKITEVRPQSWYAQKFDAWKEYLTTHPDDIEGWIYCYKAAEFARSNSDALQSIIEMFPADQSGSVADLWIRSRQLGWTGEGLDLLANACDQVADNQLLPEKILLAEVTGNDRATFTKKLDESGLIYPSLMNYSYNVLMSVEDNGFLFVNSDNTTIPLWVLQDVYNIRKDVTILNLDLLKNESYRSTVLNGLNYPENLTTLMKLPGFNPDVSFYYALTTPTEETAYMEDKLYIVGLATKMSQTEIDNYVVLKENIEEKFLLDYLSVDFYGEPKYATGKMLTQNYIVPFYVLKQYYDQIDDLERSEFWKEEIIKVAEKTQIGSRIKLLFDESVESIEFKKIDIDIKSLDKNMAQIKDNLYANRFEVTNADYGTFVDYLKQNGYDELYQKARINLDKYELVNRQFHVNYHDNYKSSNGNYGDYPVMDLTHEAAILYCDWLTSQYNQQEKRTFKKVKFRLPTKDEWQIMALGFRNFQTWQLDENIVVAKLNVGKSAQTGEFKVAGNEVDYPWYNGSWEHRNKISNEHGCYLANVMTEEKVYCPSGIIGDGYKITSPVGSYFANGMGFYDVVGNVAEMIDVSGEAMGGSWGHGEKESTIHSVNTYEIADPMVGFRIFMEVIEK